MHKRLFQKVTPWCFGATLLLVPPALADFENLEAPFSLTFGMDAGNSSGAELLMTPSPAPFSLDWDNLKLTAGHASAMAVVTNVEPGPRFTLRAALRPEQFVPGKPDDRVGFAILGGPHDPPESGFDTTDGEFYALTWSPSIDATTSVIEIREGFNGALLGQEIWGGRHPTADAAWDGLYEIYQLEALGAYDATGALELTFTLTDQQGHSQSVSASIAEPRDGNLFGFGGLLSSDPAGQPQFAFMNFSMSDNVILDEAFVDGERLVQDLPHTSAWYGSPGNTGAGNNLFQHADGIITLDLTVTLNDVRQNGQLLTYFTDSDPVTLGVGEALRVLFDFQMTAAGNTNQGVRIGIMDSSGGGGRVTADLQGTSHSRFNGYTGYGGFFNPGGGGVTSIRKRNAAENALLSGNAVWPTQTSIPGNVVIHDNDDYSAEIVISRHPDRVNVSFSLFGDNIDPNTTVSWDDTGDGLFAFDTFAIWVNQNGANTLSLTSAEITVIPVEVPVGATFAAWQAEHFPGETNPDIIGPNANPSGDGIQNFLKYAFGLDPFPPAALGNIIETDITDGKLRLTYPERAEALDIDYIPEVSVNLVDWDSGPGHVEEVGRDLLPGGEFYSVTVEAVMAGDPQKAFLRVVVMEK